LLASACAQAPSCDFTQLIGKCSAQIDTVGNQVVVKAERCSEVDVDVDGKRNTVRPSERGRFVADTEKAVDIKACRLYQATQ
jgi:hypothetical protein